MPRHPATARAVERPAIPKTIQFLGAALAAGFLITAFATRAPAQTQEARCGAGLMQPSQAGTGTLLLKTATPGCYLPAPRVAADISVDVAGPLAGRKLGHDKRPVQ